jgi:hypothetical protein
VKLNIYAPEILEKKVFSSGVQIVPASVVVSIFDPDGTALIESEAGSVDDAGTMTFELEYDNISDWELGKNYRILWEYYMLEEPDSGWEDETPRRVSDLFDLVGFTFAASEIDADDLFRAFPFLEEIKEIKTGTATGGTTTKIIDASILDSAAFPVKGSRVEFRTGNNAGAVREVTAFTAPDLTLSPALSVTVASGDRYYLKKGYTVEISSALDAVEVDLYQAGVEMENIVDIEQIKPLTLLRAARDICFSRIRERDDVWTYRYEGLEKRYQQELGGLKLKLSTEGDGVMDEVGGVSQIEAVR